MQEFIVSIITIAWAFLKNAAPWILLSFVLAMILHNASNSLKVRQQLGTKSPLALIKVTLLGMLLPICDCGTVPIGISLYYSGAYLGPVLNFVTSTPMINPASVILAYGILGPQLTVIYVIAGFVIPMLVGLVANWLSGDELSIETNPKFEGKVHFRDEEKKSFKENMLEGFYYVLNDFGVVVSKYTILGVLGAAFITTVVPHALVQKLLGDPSMVSITSITVLASIIFVCAIGHIPFVGALLAAGAAPGAALTFLVIGSATNFTENINLYKMIGKKAMLLNLVQLILYGMALGWITNKLLMPGFKPVIDIDASTSTVQFVNSSMILFPKWVEVGTSAIIILFALKALYPKAEDLFYTLKERVQRS